MLTNLENQLREQNATDRLDEVLAEIPSVREDLGFIPLVTPTSQIVGSQAVLNVLGGERYGNITKETAGVLKGEYGATPAPLNAALQQRILNGEQPVTCRPADLLEPEMDRLTVELRNLAKEKDIRLAEAEIDDVLTYALFPQVGARFLENRGNPDAFESPPDAETPKQASPPGVVAAQRTTAVAAGPAAYVVKVNGKAFNVEVAESGALAAVASVGGEQAVKRPADTDGEALQAALAGNVFKLLVGVGDRVQSGQPVLVLEAMKMETDISAPRDGTVTAIHVAVGDSVSVGDALLSIR
jgi:oxaloacetate decarboxylase alpha subunit